MPYQQAILNVEARDDLKALGFTDATLDAISNCEFLAKMLNDFVLNEDSNGRKGTFEKAGGSEYEPKLNRIYIQQEAFSSSDQHMAVLHLAHEIGHALSQTRIDTSSVDAAARSSLEWEGEAIYYEFQALYEIYFDQNKYQEYTVALWRDNISISTKDNIYSEIFNIVRGNGTLAYKFEELGKLNTEFIRENIEPSGVEYTYDEFIKWEWLKLRTDITIDYLEAFDYLDSVDIDYNERRADVRGDINGRIISHVEIEVSPEYTFDMKVLLNQAHEGRPALGENPATNYFGTDGNDTIRAEANGSVLGSENGREVLWGGKGNDELHGSSISDILLGGDDNDTLYGHDYSDLLAGNRGNDYLYGGNGTDMLNGGEGDDYLYGDDGPSPDGNQYLGVLYPGTDILQGGSGDDHLYGGEDNDILFGDDEANLMTGNDTLNGGTGDDTLNGGQGNDTYVFELSDPQTQSKQGLDTIVDDSGANKILLNLASGTVELSGGRQISPYQNYFRDSENDSISYYFKADSPNSSLGTLTVYVNNGAVAEIKDFNLNNNNFGLSFEPFEQVNPGSSMTLGQDTAHYITVASEAGDVLEITTGNTWDIVYGGEGTEIIDLGGGSANYAEGGKGSDIIRGGTGKDYLVGDSYLNTDSGGNDLLVGGDGSDMIVACGGDDVIVSGSAWNEAGDSDETGDFVAAGSGHDVVYGSQDRDKLNGGVGNDIIYGNGGDDWICGDSDDFIERTRIPGNMIDAVVGPITVTDTGQDFVEMTISELKAALGSAGFQQYLDYHNQFDYFTIPLWEFNLNESTGEWGNWFDLEHEWRKTSLTPSGVGGYYTPIPGQAGRYIDLDRRISNLLPGSCDDRLFGGDGVDAISGHAGNDIVDGGNDDDALFGDGDPLGIEQYGLQMQYVDGFSAEGDDQMYGGAGADLLWGGGGSDTLYADESFIEGQKVRINVKYDAAGNLRVGDGSRDRLYGNDGNDILVAGTGGDQLYGEDGQDTLYADIASNAMLDGGSGNDALVIGMGSNNTFEGGSGRDAYVIDGALLSGGDGLDTISDSDGNWVLSLNSRIINGNAAGLTVVGENSWRIDSFDLWLSGNGDLNISLVQINADGTAQRVGKQIVITGAASHDGFWAMNLPEVSVPKGNLQPTINGEMDDIFTNAGTLLTFFIPTGLFHDPDGESLTYRAALADGSPLPNWLAFDEEAGAFSGVPPLSWKGQPLEIKIWAGDGERVSDAITFTIHPEETGGDIIALKAEQAMTASVAEQALTVSIAGPAMTFSMAGRAMTFSMAKWTMTVSMAVPAMTASMAGRAMTFLTVGRVMTVSKAGMAMIFLCSDAVMATIRSMPMIATRPNGILCAW